MSRNQTITEQCIQGNYYINNQHAEIAYSDDNGDDSDGDDGDGDDGDDDGGW